MKNRRANKIQDFRINLIMDQMGTDESASLLAALHDRDIPHVAISEVLATNGYNVSPNAVANWRRVHRGQIDE
tara:strand:- start:386 stop:604 length:219 start_codon:yes stop_codon:yes gene_type:complete